VTPGPRAGRPRARRSRSDVDQEAGAPAEPGDIGLDERAADHLAADRGQPERHPVDAERATVGLVAEADGDDRQHLRHHERAGGALDDARRDQRLTRGSETAGRGGEREQRQAGHVDAPASEAIARAPGEDQEGGEAQAVAGDDPDQRAGARVHVDRDRRQRDVDDEEVENDHHGTCKQGR
jgi:hypothetical protein